MAPRTRTDLLDHPAALAWREVQPEQTEPTSIDTVKDKPSKSCVYRLHGVGPGGSDVIAKRCPRATAILERAMYQEVLRHLPVPTLRYYGLVEEGGGEFCWLFVEDAGREPYLPALAEHRALAGQWLGAVHRARVSAELRSHLPDRGARHYLERLRSVRDAIVGNLVNPALTAEHREILATIVSQCNLLEPHWSEVVKFCDTMPRGIVHADLVAHNVRIRNDRAGVTFLAFDWGTSGWGVPAVDLAQFTHHSVSPDITAYWSVVRESWPRLDIQDVRRLAEVGRIFRSLAGIYWRRWSVGYRYQYDYEHEWLADCMRPMRAYQLAMADAMRAMGWDA